MKNINNISGILVLALLCLFSACKKVDHNLKDQIVSINEATVSSLQVGKKLKVGFIGNNVTTFDFNIVKDGTILLTESVSFTDGQRIIEREFDIPNDASWIGSALLQVKYNADGQVAESSHPIIFEESNPAMYIVGGSVGSGWEPTLAAPMSLYGTESKTQFETFEYITIAGDGFKFIPTNVNWVDAYGKAAEVGLLMQGEEVANLVVDKDAFYRVRMDSEALTYELLELKMSIIGDATVGKWDNDTPMTFDGGKGTYLWKVTTNLVAGKMKFRANNDWAINFGGTLDNITINGADIEVASSGTYLIELDLTPGAFKAVLQKQ